MEIKISLDNFGYLLIIFAVILLIILTFVKINFDKQAVFLCDAVASDPNLDMMDCPAHQGNTSWLIVSAFGIGFLVLGIGMYMTLAPKVFQKQIINETKKSFKKINILDLDNDEKNIYGVLKNKDGATYQSDLIKETNIGKVKMTRVLDKMEQKELIERKRRGMTNLVTLK